LEDLISILVKERNNDKGEIDLGATFENKSYPTYADLMNIHARVTEYGDILITVTNSIFVEEDPDRHNAKSCTIACKSPVCNISYWSASPTLEKPLDISNIEVHVDMYDAKHAICYSADFRGKDPILKSIKGKDGEVEHGSAFAHNIMKFVCKHLITKLGNM
jgi:hypothetical protein